MGILDLLSIGKIKEPWDKYYTKEELNFKIPNKTMYEFVLESKNKYPNNRAIQYFNKKITYKKLIDKIDKMARTFTYYDIKKGDIVTICMPNTPEVLISLYALNKIGAVAHMLHPLSAEEEIKDAVNKTKSKILLIIDMNYTKIKNIIDDTDIFKVVFIKASDSMDIVTHIGYNLTKKKYLKYPKTEKYISWKRFYKKYKKQKNIEIPELDKESAAVILNSGGTSGKPKYVVIPNKAFNASAIQEKIALKKLVPGDSTIAIMPNFHGFGLSVCMHTPLSFGFYTILIPQFDSRKFDVMLNKYKPSTILGVPTLYEALIKSNNVKNLDLSYMKYVVSGGDTINKNLEEKINKYLKQHNCDTKITQGYGLTEGLAAVSLCFDDKNKSGSIGIPLPTNHIKIIDPATRKRVKPNVIGEICISGPTIMKGYFLEEAETNDALQVHSDSRVWLHTGDMGHMDSDGFLYYDQRIKRLIITSGYNVYPSHIEEVIEKHPDVLQCTVVSMPHPYKVNVPKAFIVLREGKTASIIKKIEIKDYCKKNLAHYMCPYKIVFRKSLPKTKLGKIDFKTLQDDDGDDDIV